MARLCSARIHLGQDVEHEIGDESGDGGDEETEPQEGFSQHDRVHHEQVGVVQDEAVEGTEAVVERGDDGEAGQGEEDGEDEGPAPVASLHEDLDVDDEDDGLADGGLNGGLVVG